MKIIKLISIIILFSIIKVSFLSAQTDTASAPPVSVYGKTDTVIKKKGFKDTLSIKDKLPQDAPDSTGFFIETKNGESNLRIYASIRLYGAYDFNGLKGGSSFSINEIPFPFTV